MPNRRIEEVMSDMPLVHLPPSATVSDAAKLMSEKHISAIAVNDAENGELDGIFTERDLVDRVVAAGLDPKTTPLSEVMTKHPVSVTTDQTVLQAMGEMRDNNLRHLPVMKNGQAVGMVSMRDFVGTEIAEMDHEREIAKGIWEHMR